MANYLASIFGTEADKVNCSFYYKIGACRHGDRCSRKHVKPSYSQTILLPNLYQNPAYDPKIKMNASQLQNHFDAFYEDFWCEMCKFGEIEEVVVCDNNNDRKSHHFLSTDLPFPFRNLDSTKHQLTVILQTLLGMSMHDLSTKILPRKPATRSTLAGMLRAPFTVNYHQLQTFEKHVAD
jgi:hypothetical protein